MEQEFREARRVFRRAYQLGQDVQGRIYRAFSLVPNYALYASTFIASAAIILHAYMIHQQFYPAVMFLMSSKLAIMILDIQFVVLAYLFFKLLTCTLFGLLTVTERAELYETAWYDILDGLMLISLVKGETTHAFVLEIILLCMSKAVLFLTDLRVDGLAVALEIPKLTHFRNIGPFNVVNICLSSAAIVLTMTTSIILWNYAYTGVLINGSIHQLVLGVEHTLIITALFYTAVKYGILMYARCNPGFYRKDEILKCAEVINCLIRFVCYFLTISYLSLYDVLPFFLLRNVYHTLKDFTESFDTWRRARNALRAIESNLFDITPEQLASLEDRTCAICRDEMTATTQQKRLLCGHCFHVQCVRDWFQRAPSCPTCRAEVIRPQGPQTAQDVNAPRENRGEEGAAGLGRLPPELVEVLNRLARMANDAHQNNNEGARMDGVQDYNVHISVTQNSYLLPPAGPPATLPLPIPNDILQTMDLSALASLADSLMQSIHVRNEWTRTMLASLVHDRRSIIQGVDEIHNVVAHFVTRMSEARQAAHISQVEMDRLSAQSEHIQQLIQDVHRIAEAAEEQGLRGLAVSTRDASTQCSLPPPSRHVSRLFSDGELSRRRIPQHRNIRNIGQPIERSVSDEAIASRRHNTLRRASSGVPSAIWTTALPSGTRPPTLTFVNPLFERPRLENGDDGTSSVWSTETRMLSQDPPSLAPSGINPSPNEEELQNQLRERRIARFMEEE